MRLDHLLSRETVWRRPGRQTLRWFVLGPVVGLGGRGPSFFLAFFGVGGGGGMLSGSGAARPGVVLALGAAGWFGWLCLGVVGWLVVNCIADASICLFCLSRVCGCCCFACCSGCGLLACLACFCLCCFFGRSVDALAPGADEGRGGLRYASGSRLAGCDPRVSEWGYPARVVPCHPSLN